MYDKLDAKVNSIGTSRFDFKIKYNKYKSQRENRIPDTSGLVKKTDYNVKINETAGKKTSISGLATNTTLTVVENKILSVSNLVKKKTDYEAKITETEKKRTDHNHDKYITTPEFNTLAADVFSARLAQTNLVTKTDFDAKLSTLNRKITANKTNENELKKLKTFDSIYSEAQVTLKKMAHKIL